MGRQVELKARQYLRVPFILLCGRQRTGSDDVVLTSLQFSKSGTWHPADPALLTKFDMDT